MSAVTVRTLRDAVDDAAAVLERAGCDTPRLDAELLAAAAVGVERERIHIDGALPLAPEAGAPPAPPLRARPAPGPRPHNPPPPRVLRARPPPDPPRPVARPETPVP